MLPEREPHPRSSASHLPQSAIRNLSLPYATKVQYPIDRCNATFFLVKTGIPVYIIDDDPSVVRGLVLLLTAHGYHAQTFAAPRELLASDLPPADTCLIIDVAMPEMNGMQLYAELLRRGCKAPAIFITALDEPAVQASVASMNGARLFRKPVDGNELMKAVKGAVWAEPR